FMAVYGREGGWIALGAAIFGAMAAVGVTTLAWVVGLVLLARREFGPGRRALPVLVAVGTAVAIAGLWLAAGAIAGNGGDPLGAALTAQLALPLAGVVGFVVANNRYVQRDRLSNQPSGPASASASSGPQDP